MYVCADSKIPDIQKRVRPILRLFVSVGGKAFGEKMDVGYGGQTPPGPAKVNPEVG